MIRRTLITALLLGTLVLATGAALAQDAFKVGFVDLGKVTEKYTKLQERDNEIQKWLVDRRAFLTRLDDYLFLSNESFRESLALLQLAEPLPDDKKKRFDELTGLAAAKEKEYLDLRSVPNRNAQQNENYQGLSTLFNLNRQEITGLQTQYNKEYNDKIAAARAEFRLKVREVCAGLAKEQGFGLILDSDTVLAGGVDLTDAVLQKLNQA